MTYFITAIVCINLGFLIGAWWAGVHKDDDQPDQEN